METKELLKLARERLKAQEAKRLQAVNQGGKTPLPSQTKGVMPESAKKLLRNWGVKSFAQLADVNTADRKYSYLTREDKEKVKSLKEAIDVCVLSSMIFKKPIKELKYFNEEFDFHLKAFGIDSGDNGFEWIPEMVSSSYIDEFNLERKVSGLFMEVKMPSDPYRWPVLTNGAIARKVGEVSALSTPQVFKTDKTILFESVKMTNQYALPEELNEDSAVDMVKAIRGELVEGQEKAMEIAILEGDTAGSLHHFSQLPDVAGGTLVSGVTDSPEYFFDGIRKRVLAAHALTALSSVVDAGDNAVSETETSQCRAKMGKFGVDPSQLAWISSPKVYFQMLNLDDVRTIEQYGPAATVLSGELAKYEGAPVIVSEYLREDTASTGKNTSTAGNNTQGSLMLVNRKRWFVGARRPIQLLVEKNRTQYDVLDMVSFQRKAFQAVLKSDGSNYATESSAAMIINIGL